MLLGSDAGSKDKFRCSSEEDNQVRKSKHDSRQNGTSHTTQK